MSHRQSDQGSSGARGLKEQLTERERQCVEAVAAGSSYKRAAEDLGISLNTVKTHLKVAYLKLGVDNCREAGASLKGRLTEQATERTITK